MRERTVLQPSREAIEWGMRAIELAERVGADEALARALNYVGTVELSFGEEAVSG